MVSSTANIEWTSDDAQVLRSFNKVENNLDDIARKLNKVERASKRSAKATKTGFDKVANSIGGIVGGIVGVGGIVSAYQMWSSASQQLLKEAEAIADKYDEIGRKIRIQGGLTRLQGEDAQERLGNLATGAAVTRGYAGQVAVQLMGSGLDYKAATGGAASEILKGISATSTAPTPLNPTAFTEAVVNFLQSQGTSLRDLPEEKQSKVVKDLVKRVASLVLSGDVKGAEFARFAEEATTFKGLLTSEEQLSAFAALRQNMTAQAATISLRQFVTRSIGHADKAENMATLKGMGLSPEDVDFTGETLKEVISAYQGGLANLDPAAKNRALIELFGQEAIKGARAILNKKQGFKGRLDLFTKIQRTSPKYKQAAEVAGEGAAATEQRLKNLVEEEKRERAFGADAIDRAREAMLLQTDASYPEKVGNRVAVSTLRFFGLGPDTLLFPPSYQEFQQRPGASPDAYRRQFADPLQVLKNLVQSSGGDTGNPKLNQLIADNIDAIDRFTDVSDEIINEFREIGEKPRVRNPPAAAQAGGGLR